MTDITEDDRRRAKLLVNEIDQSLMQKDHDSADRAAALALAETRERAEAQVGEIMMQQATRIDALQAENVRLQDAVKRAELGYQDGLG